MLRSCIGRVLLGFFICANLAGASAHATSAYFIGNSLTWDMQPLGLAALAASDRQFLLVGHHVLTGKSLDYTTSHPRQLSLLYPLSPAGSFDEALPKQPWDVVAMQPFNSATSTLRSDLEAMQKLIGETSRGPSSSTRFYIYEAWAPRYAFESKSSYQQYWEAVVPDDLSQPTSRQRRYMETLQDKLVQHYGGQKAIAIIPIGEVFNELDKRIHSGALPDVRNISDLYRDLEHLNEVGRYVAAITVFSTIFRKDPNGLSIPPGFYNQGDGPIRLTPALASKLQAVVWDVVSQYPRSELPVPKRAISSLPKPERAKLREQHDGIAAH